MPPPTFIPIEDLRYTREVLSRCNNPAAARMVRRFDAYLNPFADISADAALAVLPAPGQEHWRTVDRRRIRDDELRTLAQRYLAGERQITDRVKKLEPLIDSYGIRWRNTDSHASAMPAEYRDTPREHLYRAY